MSPGKIGELVRSVRKTLGLTQAELAELRKVADVMRAVGLEVSDEPDPIEITITSSPDCESSGRSTRSRSIARIAEENRALKNENDALKRQLAEERETAKTLTKIVGELSLELHKSCEELASLRQVPHIGAHSSA